ncbi:MAG TPA: hypothetical protein VE397_02755 [Stellaceae bacterium]|nr:hypothetical protein [Stellaceae bacterium]
MARIGEKALLRADARVGRSIGERNSPSIAKKPEHFFLLYAAARAAGRATAQSRRCVVTNA